MRIVGGGRQLSWRTAWSIFHLLFTGEILLLRRAHGFGRLFPSWWDFQPSDFSEVSCRVRTAAGASFLWRGFPFWHHSCFLEQIWQFTCGAHHPGVLLADRACISSLLELLLYQVPSCIVFTVTHICFTSLYTSRSKLVFPGGVLSRVMLTKNTCVYKCMILVLRSVHNQQ